MGRKKVEGVCAICGYTGKLSYEHVPPEKAFNESRVMKARFGEHLVQLGPNRKTKGRIQQRGLGEHSLCGRCNNKTGSWYGAHFVKWCYQGMDILQRCGGKPTLLYLNYLFPLQIIKQIVTMFFTVSNGRVGNAYPYLKKFVLNKEDKYLPPNIRIYVYYNIEGRFRWTGNSLMVDFEEEHPNINDCLEFSFPPFGYYMSCSGMNAPHPEQFEISHFARYGYKEFSIQEMHLPVLPTWSVIPGDYRSREEVDASNKSSGFVL